MNNLKKKKIIMNNLKKKNLFLSLKKFRISIKKNIGHSKGKTIFFSRKTKLFKKIYIFIDFWRNLNFFGYVIYIKNDANRSANICNICYTNGIMTYTIATQNLFIGKKIYAGDNYNKALTTLSFLKLDKFKNLKLLEPGNCLQLKNIPIGYKISLIEMWPNKGFQLCRAAGSFATILKKTSLYAVIKLKSGWKLNLSLNCMATIGIVSNTKYIYINYKKAGTKRNLGCRSTVRGVAMNAVDHPHGGGRGKSRINKKPKSPWGKLTKWKKTSKSKNKKIWNRNEN